MTRPAPALAAGDEVQAEARATGWSGPLFLPTSGLRLGGLVVSPSVSMDVGYDTNPYFLSSAVAGSGFIRLGAAADAHRKSIGASYLPSVNVGLSAGYRENFEGDPRGSRTISGSLQLALAFQPAESLEIALLDALSRQQELGVPASGPVAVNRNAATVAVSFPISGRKWLGEATYRHEITHHDGQLAELDAKAHTGMLGLRWQISVSDSAGLHASVNATTYDSPERHPSSYPVTIDVDGKHLVGSATVISATLGYKKAYYQRVEDAQGIIGAITLRHLVGPRTQVSTSYAYSILDWKWGTYQREHAARLVLEQSLTQRFDVAARAGFAHRTYGPITAPPDEVVRVAMSGSSRSDDVISVAAMSTWTLRPWLSANTHVELSATRSELRSSEGQLGYRELSVSCGVRAHY